MIDGKVQLSSKLQKSVTGCTLNSKIFTSIDEYLNHFLFVYIYKKIEYIEAKITATTHGQNHCLNSDGDAH